MKVLNFCDFFVQVKLVEVKTVLERRIGVSLDEIDEYLHAYKFGPETLLAMVGYFLEEGDPDQRAFEEIAGEIDGFLWTYSETGTINPDTFLALFEVSRSLGLPATPTLYWGVLFKVFLCVHRLDHLSVIASIHIVHSNFLTVGAVLRNLLRPHCGQKSCTNINKRTVLCDLFKVVSSCSSSTSFICYCILCAQCPPESY